MRTKFSDGSVLALVNGASIAMIAAYYAVGDSNWLIAVAAALNLCLLMQLRVRTLNTLTIAGLLLLGTGYPIALSLYHGGYLLAPTDTRLYFYRDYNLSVALFCVLLQTQTLLAFGLFRSHSASFSGVSSRTLTRTGKIALMAIVVVSSILSNPTGTVLSGGYGGEGFRSAPFLLFGGWPLIFAMTLATLAACTGLKTLMERAFVIAVVAFWLLHGNRGEVLCVIALPALMALQKDSTPVVETDAEALNQIRGMGWWATRLAVAVFIVASVGVFQFVGVMRSTGVADATMTAPQPSSERATEISTLGASAYTLVATVGLIESRELTYRYGETFLDYPRRTLPASMDLPWTRPEDLASTLSYRIQSIGGTHFAAEPYLNLGVVGVYLFALLLAFGASSIAQRSRDSLYFRVFDITLLLYAPRVVFYGNIYLYKLLLAFVGVRVVAALLSASRQGYRPQASQ